MYNIQQFIKNYFENAFILKKHKHKHTHHKIINEIANNITSSCCKNHNVIFIE